MHKFRSSTYIKYKDHSSRLLFPQRTKNGKENVLYKFYAEKRSPREYHYNTTMQHKKTEQRVFIYVLGKKFCPTTQQTQSI